MKTSFFASLICITSLIGPANAATYYFQQGFSEDALLTGQFDATDLNNDNIIDSFFGEVTNFKAAFSGNSKVAAFDLVLPDVFAIVIDLNSSLLLGDALPHTEELMQAINPVQGSGFLAGHLEGACGSAPVCGLVSFDGASDQSVTDLLVSTSPPDQNVAPVPLPGSGVLLLGALFSGLALRRRRR